MNSTVYTIFLVLGCVIALAFSVLVFFTSKGDAMSGGSNVRTTYKGKAGFDDFVSRLVLILGCSFMGIMLILDILASRAANN